MEPISAPSAPPSRDTIIVVAFMASLVGLALLLLGLR